MPVYIVYAAVDRLSPGVKEAVARAITDAHRDLTGTNSFLAQIRFQEHEAGDVFHGGVRSTSDSIFVHGLNRLGRAPDVKRRLTERIVRDVAMAVSMPTRDVWVYIDELPATQMAEYGHILPEPGKEAEWLDRLPAADRDYMEAFSARGRS
jgi:phenylpyruvate tautomerase PptA (4-oxalocrotonate tautomerase family)